MWHSRFFRYRRTYIVCQEVHEKNGVFDYDDLLNIRVRLLVPQASTEKIELLKRCLLEHYDVDARDIEVENYNGLKIVHFTTSCHVTVPAS